MQPSRRTSAPKACLVSINYNLRCPRYNPYLSMLITQIYTKTPTPHVRTRNARARVLITISGRSGHSGRSANGYNCIELRLQIQMFYNSGGMFVPPCEPIHFANSTLQKLQNLHFS